MFVPYILQDNKVICIEVGESSCRQYYLKAKGVKPTDVYVLQDTTSVQASADQIRRMIKDFDGDCSGLSGRIRRNDRRKSSETSEH